MWLYDLNTLRFLAVNDAAVRMYGYSREEFMSMSLLDIRPSSEVPAVESWFKDLRAGRTPPPRSTWRHLRKDGVVLDVQVSVSHGLPYQDQTASCAVVFDVTEHERNLMALRTSAAALEQAQDLGDLGYSLMDLRTGLVHRSSRMLTMLGTTDEEAREKPLLGVVAPIDPGVMATLAHAREHNLSIDLKYRVMVKDVERWWHVVSKIVHDDLGSPTHRIATVHDITSYHDQTEAMRQMAYTDTVTSLPNRRALLEWECAGVPSSMLFVHFSLGGDLDAKADDQCWVNVADILCAALPKAATIFRLTEEIFVISHACDRPRAAGMAASILATFERPVVVGFQDVLLVLHIGVASSEDRSNSDDMIRNGRTALRVSLRSGQQIEFHTSDLDRQSERRMMIERRMRTAAFDDSLFVFYQPIVSLRDGRVVGAEALMRWNCEGLGFVSPVEFIPIAEDNGMVLSLGDWIMRSACAQLSTWRKAGLPFMRIAVNVSGRQAERNDFSEIVSQAILSADISSDLLDLEITETAMMNSHSTAVTNLTTLRSRGFRVSMDDFGTGYSSLSALGTLPLDVVKLDRSFVAEVTHGGFAASLISSVIELAHKSGLRVIAEGVETVEQLEALRALQCDEAQGFLFGQPVPAPQFISDYFEGVGIAGFFANDPISLFAEL